jgi:hypothetical protein
MRNYVALFLCFLILFSCQDSLFKDTTNNKKLMMEGNRVSENFINHVNNECKLEEYLSLLKNREPLYDYTSYAISPDYGYYYSIPYADENGIVQGFICYPISQNSSELGTPIDFDVDCFNEVPIEHRFFYSKLFLDLKKTGLDVSQKLTEFATILQDHVIVLSREDCERIVNTNPSTRGFLGKCFDLIIMYSVFSYANEDYVMAYDLSKLADRFKAFLRDEKGYDERTISVKLDTGSCRLYASFETNEYEYISDIQEMVDEFRSYEYSHTEASYLTIDFQYVIAYPKNLVYIQDENYPYLPIPTGTPITPDVVYGCTSSGGGFTGGSTSDLNDIMPDTLKMVVNDCEYLTLIQMNKLDSIIKKSRKHDVLNSFFEMMSEKGYKFNSIRVDSIWFTEYERKMNVKAKLHSDIMYLLEINEKSFLHEYFHLFQKKENPNFYNKDYYGMMEAERTMAYEILALYMANGKIQDSYYDILRDYNQGNVCDVDSDVKEEYSNFIDMLIVTRNLTLENKDIDKYIKAYFNNKDTIYRDSTKYKSDYPYIINKFFNPK